MTVVIDQILAGKAVDLALKGVRGALRAFRAQPDSLGRLLVLLHADVGRECDLGRDIFYSWRDDVELCAMFNRVLTGQLRPGPGAINGLADAIEPRLVRTRVGVRRQLAKRVACEVFRAVPIVVEGGGEATRLLLAHVDAIAVRGDADGWRVARRVRLNVPAGAAFFTGRTCELEELNAALAGNDRVVITQAISGLGGVGKSQLAAQYVRQHADDYDIVAWIRAEDGGTADLAKLAAKLGAPVEGLSQSDRAQLALDWLGECEQPWLLILDNIESAAQLAALHPRGGNGRVLVTSRDRSLRQFGPVLTIDVFDHDTATKYLTERAVRPTDERAARELVDALGCLPLGLSHAAAYCQSGTSFADYRELLGELPARELFDRHPEATYAQTVASTWSTSIKAASADAPLAADVLDLAAHLAPDAIPKALFLVLVDADTARGRKRLADALNALARLNLATVDDDTVSVHRLLQKVVRDHATTRNDPTAALHALAALGNAFPDDVALPPCWPLCERLLSHVHALADIMPEPGDGGPQLIDLLNRTTRYLNNAEPGRRGLPIAQRALAHAERVLGAEHPHTLRARHNLATACGNARRTEEAIAISEPLVTDSMRILGAEHVGTLRARAHLAFNYRAAGRSSEAIARSKLVLADSERILGAEHPYTLDTRNLLALAYSAARRTHEAIAIFEPLLVDITRILGAEHLDTLRIRHNLALAYRDAWRIDEAIALYEPLFASCDRILGTEHPITLMVGHGLANAYQLAGPQH